jgi:hypothetical protein
MIAGSRSLEVYKQHIVSRQETKQIDGGQKVYFEDYVQIL